MYGQLRYKAKLLDVANEEEHVDANPIDRWIRHTSVHAGESVRLTVS